MRIRDAMTLLAGRIELVRLTPRRRNDRRGEDREGGLQHHLLRSALVVFEPNDVMRDADLNKKRPAINRRAP